MQDPLSQKQDENKTNIFRIVLLISILISLTIYVKAPINQYDHITDQ